MFGFKVCWKTPNMVDREMKKLKIKSAKLHTLKEKISMGVIGLGWVDLSTTW